MPMTFQLALIFSVLFAHNSAMRTKLALEEENVLAGAGPDDTVIDTTDARKPDSFEMPTFDEMASVRRPILERHMLAKTASEVIKTFTSDKWGMNWNDTRGIDYKTWTDNNLESKIAFFRGLGGAVHNGKVKFDQFVTIPGAKDVETVDPGVSPASGPDELNDSSIKKWLSLKTRDYWQRYGGAKLTKAFLKVNKCTSWTDCETWELLLKFVQLDKDRSGTLSFPELAPYLPTTESAPHLAWDELARVESRDFEALHFPNKLRTSIIKVAHESEIAKAIWNEKHLHSTIAEFVKRDYRPSHEAEEGQKDNFDTFTGEIRFFQIADLLPDDHAPGTDFIHKIRGFNTNIHVPTMGEVAKSGEGTLELTRKDIENWLQKEEQGMTNTWAFWTDTFNHAKKMAIDVLRYGDGSIPGIPKLGFQNDRIQGVAGGDHDQWTTVAPRMAVFVHLDSDHDGNIDFQAAYPYLLPKEHAD